MLLVTAQALLVIIQQKPGGTAQTEQPKPGSDEQRNISLQTPRPWKSLLDYFLLLPTPTQTSVLPVRAQGQTCALNPNRDLPPHPDLL